ARVFSRCRSWDAGTNDLTTRRGLDGQHAVGAAGHGNAFAILGAVSQGSHGDQAVRILRLAYRLVLGLLKKVTGATGTRVWGRRALDLPVLLSVGARFIGDRSKQLVGHLMVM